MYKEVISSITFIYSIPKKIYSDINHRYVLKNENILYINVLYTALFKYIIDIFL